MKYGLRITAEADVDILAAIDWYESKRLGLGNNFSEEVFDYFEYLQKQALSHEKKFGENHELPMKRFPYVIVYCLDGNTVVILGVINTYQHPEKKQSRK